MFEELGERFNQEFNVDTDFSLQLSLFMHDGAAIKYINEKKKELVSQIDLLNWNYNQYHSYLNTITDTIGNIADISYHSIEDSFQWESVINAVVEDENKSFKATKTELENDQKELYMAAFSEKATSKQEKEIAKKQYFDIGRKIERQIITGKILAVTGEAGIGKSQMFANEVRTLIQDNRNALLFLAGLYFTDDPIQEQIIKNCELDFHFEDLIDILEAMGETQGKMIPVFIDALNETWNHALWKKHLPVIINKIEECNYVKLAFSFRSEYEKQLMNHTLIDRMKSQSICHISHRGFERNSIEATKQFFDYYGISFTLFEYFEYEMTNPLF